MRDSLACTSFPCCGVPAAGLGWWEWIGLAARFRRLVAGRWGTDGVVPQGFHRVCHGQRAGRCSMGLRAGAAKRAGTLISSPPMVVQRNHVDLRAARPGARPAAEVTSSKISGSYSRSELRAAKISSTISALCVSTLVRTSTAWEGSPLSIAARIVSCSSTSLASISISRSMKSTLSR
jgi:hypothetical protein